MKKILMALVLSAFTLGAMAEEEVPLGFQVLNIKDTDGDSGYKVQVKDIQKGVYVHVWQGMFKTLPKTTELLKEVLKSKGIKVVDSIEDADYGMQIRDAGKFGSFEKVEEDSGQYTKGEAIAKNVLTDLALMAVTGWGSSQGRRQVVDGSKPLLADLYVTVVKNPQVGSFKKLKGDDEKEIRSQIECHINRPAKKGEGFQPLLLSTMVAGFVDQHFDGLPAPSGAPVTAPASGVAPAGPVVAN